VSTADTERLQFEVLNPISMGHAAGLVVICNTYLLIEYQAKSLQRVLLLSGIVLACAVIGLANSRGPIFAVSLALMFFLLSRSYRWARLAPLVILAGLPISYFLYQDPQIIGNLLSRFTADTVYNPSDLGRIGSQTSAIAAFIENPIFGAFYRDPMLAENEYPHNLLIEAAMAMGLVGLTLMILLHVRATLFVFSKSGGQYPLIVMLLIQQFVAVSLSGAIWGADAFFMLMSMCHAFGKRPTVQSSNATREVVHRRTISSSPNTKAT
jgi:O-antigen ligase